MSRDESGNFTLATGNPVVSGTNITTNWANPTLSDIGVELTDSLSRSGKGGMLAPFKFTSGDLTSPGITWSSEPNTGLYLAGTNDMRVVVGLTDKFRWLKTAVQMWDSGAWQDLIHAGNISEHEGNFQTDVKDVNRLDVADDIADGSAAASVNLHATSGLDYSARIHRGIGVNGSMNINQTGTSAINITTQGGKVNVNGDRVLTVDDLKAAILDTVYPVGAIYISAVKTNPGALLGGTWTQIARGRCLFGEGSHTDPGGTNDSIAMGETGGEFKHTLITSELPSHNHGLRVSNQAQGSAQSSTSGGLMLFTGNATNYGVNLGAAADPIGKQIAATGSDQSHENMPPYLGVAIYERTA